jgi:hypothetical protein
MFSGFLAVGSLCGLIALGWLILQSYRRTQSRLMVTSARSPGGGLDVLIQYRPTRTRVGLKARLSLADAPRAKLMGGARQERGDRYGAFVAKMPDEAVIGQTIETRLTHLQADQPGVFSGIFYVVAEGDAPITAARVRLEIWTDVGPTRLISREVTVRAINW